MSNFSHCANEQGFEMKCLKCKRTYYNRQCYENHQKQMCNLYKKCELCYKVYQTVQNKEHVCGEKFCRRW